MQKRLLKSMFISCIVVPVLIFLLSSATHAGVVAMWTFDEDEGDEVSDLSGNGNDGVIHGGVEWIKDGKFGGALSFNGADGWVEVPSSPDLTPPEITFMAWVYLENFDTDHAVIEKYDWVAGKGSFIIRVFMDRAVKVGCMRGTDPSIGAKAGALDDKEWIHLAGSVDKDSVKFFVNGEELLVTKMPDSDGVLPSDASLSLGSRGDTHDTHWFAGLMDEAAIFDEALSAGEIERVMKFGLQNYMAVCPKEKLSVTWGTIKNSL